MKSKTQILLIVIFILFFLIFFLFIKLNKQRNNTTLLSISMNNEMVQHIGMTDFIYRTGLADFYKGKLSISVQNACDKIIEQYQVISYSTFNYDILINATDKNNVNFCKKKLFDLVEIINSNFIYVIKEKMNFQKFSYVTESPEILNSFDNHIKFYNNLTSQNVFLFEILEKNPANHKLKFSSVKLFNTKILEAIISVLLFVIIILIFITIKSNQKSKKIINKILNSLK